ncbi:MAG: ABC transporter ATP-binding protein [Alphaproteobacteria bacterium]
MVLSAGTDVEARGPERAPAGAPILAIDGLSVSFPRFGQQRRTVLRDIALRVDRGEVVALVGESGSGKTMLARAAMRLVPAPGRIDRGAIAFDGQDLTKLGEEALRRLRGRDMAMVVSNPRGELDPLRTVGRQIGDVLKHHLGLGERETRARTLELLRDVQIPDPERRYRAFPHELSGGMAQRVVMAIALACSPKFIISDDATSGLDVTVQAQVLELLRRLISERGSSMLFITRDIGIAAHFADRIAVIYAGQIVEVAGRTAFFDDPAHPYTVLLLAAFSHNAKLRRYWLREDVAEAGVAGPPEAGCVFRDRCVRAQPRCATEPPELRQLGPGHLVRCHFPIER